MSASADVPSPFGAGPPGVVVRIEILTVIALLLDRLTPSGGSRSDCLRSDSQNFNPDYVSMLMLTEACSQLVRLKYSRLRLGLLVER